MSSLLAFLMPLAGESIERSSSLKRRSQKRYWGNVSDVFFQSQSAARSVPRRAKMTSGAVLPRRPRIEEPLRFLDREQRLCMRL